MTAPPTTDRVPNHRPPSSDALLGRIVRLKTRRELDDALDAIWGAAFELLEAAEQLGQKAPQLTHLVDQLEATGDTLWRTLEAADRVYCGLAQLCAAHEPPAPGRS